MSRRTASAALAIAAVLVLTAGSAQATPGDLDTSFGSGGKVTTSFGTGADYGNATALQPDGKIVVGGTAAPGSGTAFALVRYNPDGSLDSGFGTGGKVTTVFGIFSGATAVEVQPDGKIVAAGQSYNGSDSDFALARYNSDGSLDSSFGSGGKVTTAIRTKSDGVLALALQPDGKIVAGGYSEDSTFIDDFALARYNPDGSLDTSFGTGGKVVTAIGSDHDDINWVTLQPDGKIVAVGYGKPASTYQFAVVRYASDGSLDTGFGSGGKVTTSIGSLDDEASAGALQPDGKIVAAGFTKVGSDRYFGLARYNADGSLDSGFGSSGTVTTPIGTDDNVNDLALQPDGRIVAAGYAYVGSPPKSDIALARYNADGSLDSSFGTGGKVTTSIASVSNVARAVELQPDGKIVAAGLSIEGSDWDFAVVRYLGSTLTVAKAGSGSGTVSSSPSGIDCGSTCSAPFAAVPVTLTAAASAGSSFTGWSGDCTGTGTCMLTMSADHAATATFETDKTLTITKAGSGTGTVSSGPSGIDCGSTCSHAYAHGTSVTLSATASAGSSFVGWSGDCTGTGTCSLTMSADHAATATFESDKTLTVSKAGAGSGTVSSSPAGISCGSSCTHAYTHGTSVTLTAAASSRSKFAGWSGVCSGTGACTLTMSADRSATATFKLLCIVPKVKGKRLRAAKAAIRRAHCSVGRVRRAFSARVRKGRVISQKPAPGKKLAPGAKVKLKVSKGKKA